MADPIGHDLRVSLKKFLFPILAILLGTPVPTVAVANLSDGSFAAANAAFTVTTNNVANQLDLTANVTIAESDRGKAGNIYIGALVGQQWYFLSGGNWVPWQAGAIPIYRQGALADAAVALSGGSDLSGLIGTQIYAGYGTDEFDMLAKNNYSAVYTIPPANQNALSFSVGNSNLPGAEKGKTYSYSFCIPVPSSTTALCPESGNPAVNPVGGAGGPYHFQLDSGYGFPPTGISLNLNGLLTGTPAATGTNNFRVCAVDLGGNQACQSVTLTVSEAASGGDGGGGNPQPVGTAWTLSVEVSGDGRIWSSDGAINCPTRCTATYDDATPSPILTASSGYVSWGGSASTCLSGYGNSCQPGIVGTAGQTYTVTATFR